MKKNLFRQTTVEGNFKEYVYTYFDVIHVIKVIFPSTSGFNSSHKKSDRNIRSFDLNRYTPLLYTSKKLLAQKTPEIHKLNILLTHSKTTGNDIHLKKGQFSNNLSR